MPAARAMPLRPSQVPVVPAWGDGVDAHGKTSLVLDVVGKGGGQPLAPEVRADMESRLGADFSNVRVHTDAQAAKSAAAVSAQAYTVGNEVVFGHGSFAPDSAAGKRTLAHELAHVQQQRKGPVSGTDTGGGVAISDPSDDFEQEAEATASRALSDPTMAAHRPDIAGPAGPLRLQRPAGNTAVRPVATGPVVQRLKDSPSPFQGWAGEADIRAAQAGSQASAPAEIKVSAEYSLQQAEVKQQQMEAFLRADIPFVSNNQAHPAYSKLIDLRNGYLDDPARISLAMSAYSNFVMPATLAAKSIAQFREIQRQLGFLDEDNPAGDLNRRQLRALSQHLSARTLTDLNNAVASKAMEAQGERTTLLGIFHNLQSGLQAKKAELAARERAAAEAEKAEIQEKIKAVTEGIEKVTKVIEALAFVAGAPEAVGDIGAFVRGEEEGEFVKAAKGAGELGSHATSLIGSAAEFFLQRHYLPQLQEAQTRIMEASTAISHAQRLGVEFANVGWELQAQGSIQKLQGFMGDWLAALEKRKEYYAQLGLAADRASGGRAGGEVSQYLAYVSQAAETQSFVQQARTAADNAMNVIRAQISAILRHRKMPYTATAAAVWSGIETVDPDGPDVGQLYAALDAADPYASENVHRSRTYIGGEYQRTAAEAADASAASVVGSLPAAS